MNLAETLTQEKWRIMTQYLSDRRPLKYFRAHAAAVEKVLCQLWMHHFGSNSPLALLAIGGFGRNELYPYSDLDMAIVAPHELTDNEQNTICQFIQMLWDMQLSPAVKSGSLKQLCQSAKDDLTTDTAFLEARPIAGDVHFAEYAITQLNAQRDTVAFIEGKLLEMQQRHAKQPALMLEPNIKNGAGGLRDIHTMMWLAKVQNLRTDFRDLQQKNIITPIELGMLRSSHRTLARLRIELHLASGREEDRLVFDLQNTVAANLQYSNHAQQGMERLMHQFYRATKMILQLNQIILPMLRGRVFSDYPRITQQIDPFYYQVNHKIAVRNLKLFEQQPEHIFRIMHMLQTHPDLHAIAPQTLRAWWIAVQHLGDDFYHNAEYRAQFLQFFQHGKRLTEIMRLLNLYGMLARYLPAWDKIVGLLQHDLFHVYPVDDHILMVLRNVRRLASESHNHELPFASSLMQSFENKYVLYLAALFHDIAKGRNGDHAKLGVHDALRFAADHRLPENDGKLLAWLVEQHLLFSVVAQKQDINDPDVIARFCQEVNSMEKLIALYLLTVADIRGTNMKIWNSWKAQLLENLFQAASRHLAGQHHNKQNIAHNRKQHAFELLKQKNHSDKQIRQLWQVLGDAYFVYYHDDAIAWQLPALIDAPEQPCVQIRIQPHANMLQILVYMQNGERLFTRICRIISQLGLDILAAQALITAHDFILDMFMVALPENSTADDAARLQQKLQQKLDDFTQGKLNVNTHSSKVSRRARYQPIVPHVLLLPEENDWYTLEIIATNRPALLADITEVFARHQVRLYHANIATLADRVEDTFLLHCPNFTGQEWAFTQDLLAVLNQHTT